MIKIGFAGFSQQVFDRKKAINIITHIFDYLLDKYGTFEVVSGLTDYGIPSLVYAEGTYRDMRLIGIACSRANDDDCEKFPVDDEIIVGDSWGDESDTFIDYIDVFVRIGGGPQTKAEEKMAKEKGIPTFAFEPDQDWEEPDV